MQNSTLSKATLSRLPIYLQFVRTVNTEMTSATAIARNLGLGEVQVRKDLASVSRGGMPKVGYPVRKLQRDLERALGIDERISAVIIGAGKMGTALMEYGGFRDYGLEIAAAFDNHASETPFQHGDMKIYAMSQLKEYCQRCGIHLAILTVPASSAQDAADQITGAGITAILNFAPCHIKVPFGVTVQQVNVALSLAHLNLVAGNVWQDKEDEYYGKQIV